MKKYAIRDFITGEYTFYDTDQDMITILAQQIIHSYLRLNHNSLWAVVEFNEDGSQTWRDATGNEIPDPVALRAQMEAELASLLAASTSTSTSTTITVE